MTEQSVGPGEKMITSREAILNVLSSRLSQDSQESNRNRARRGGARKDSLANPDGAKPRSRWSEDERYQEVPVVANGNVDLTENRRYYE